MDMVWLAARLGVSTAEDEHSREDFVGGMLARTCCGRKPYVQRVRDPILPVCCVYRSPANVRSAVFRLLTRWAVNRCHMPYDLARAPEIAKFVLARPCASGLFSLRRLPIRNDGPGTNGQCCATCGSEVKGSFVASSATTSWRARMTRRLYARRLAVSVSSQAWEVLTAGPPEAR